MMRARKRGRATKDLATWEHRVRVNCPECGREIPWASEEVTRAVIARSSLAKLVGKCPSCDEPITIETSSR